MHGHGGIDTMHHVTGTVLGSWCGDGQAMASMTQNPTHLVMDRSIGCEANAINDERITAAAAVRGRGNAVVRLAKEKKRGSRGRRGYTSLAARAIT
jgi:hypothetical protein